MMQMGIAEVTVCVAAGSAALGYIGHLFTPKLVDMIAGGKKAKVEFVKKEEHEIQCRRVHELIGYLSVDLKGIHDEVRWLRAVTVVQTPKEIIDKANEIVGT